MNAAHIHLVLTHWPIVGTMLTLLILVYAKIAQKKEVETLSYLLFILMTLFTIPVFVSGGGAEEIVENLPGVTEGAIHEHEELAEVALNLMIALGILALATFTLLRLKKKVAGIFSWITLVLAIVVSGVFVRVGNLGGQIRHTEMNAQSQIDERIDQGESAVKPSQGKEYEDHDEEDD